MNQETSGCVYMSREQTSTSINLDQAVKTLDLIRRNKNEMLQQRFLVEVENIGLLKNIIIDKLVKFGSDRGFWERILGTDMLNKLIRRIEWRIKDSYEKMITEKIRKFLRDEDTEILDYILDGTIVCQYTVLQDEDDFGIEYISVLCKYKLSERDVNILEQTVEETIREYIYT